MQGIKKNKVEVSVRIPKAGPGRGREDAATRLSHATPPPPPPLVRVQRPRNCSSGGADPARSVEGQTSHQGAWRCCGTAAPLRCCAVLRHSGRAAAAACGTGTQRQEDELLQLGLAPYCAIYLTLGSVIRNHEPVRVSVCAHALCLRMRSVCASVCLRKRLSVRT